MNLLTYLNDQYMYVSVLQMAVSSGKHTTIEYLIREAERQGVTLGITAPGYGGVKLGAQSPTDRLEFGMTPGTIVTIPEQLYDESEAGLEILKLTDCPTVLGRILICRTVTEGNVIVAGPVAANYRRAVCEQMAELGADLVIIDRTLSGRGDTYEGISDAAVLCTGAVVAQDMKQAVEKTAHMVMMYSMPQMSDEDALGIIQSERTPGKILMLRKYRGIADDAGPAYDVQKLDLKTRVGGTKYLDRLLDENVRYIYVPGLFTPQMIKDISMYNLSQVTFVVDDPSEIVMGQEAWAGLTKRGMKIEVLKNINIAAVTVNPYAPLNYSFDAREFSECLRRAMPGIKVINVREEEGYAKIGSKT